MRWNCRVPTSASAAPSRPRRRRRRRLPQHREPPPPRLPAAGGRRAHGDDPRLPGSAGRPGRGAGAGGLAADRPRPGPRRHPFPIELEFGYRDPGMPLPIAVALTAELGVDGQKSRIDARDVQLQLTPNSVPPSKRVSGCTSTAAGTPWTSPTWSCAARGSARAASSGLSTSAAHRAPRADWTCRPPIPAPAPRLAAAVAAVRRRGRARPPGAERRLRGFGAGLPPP